jgi:hypothetical protein
MRFYAAPASAACAKVRLGKIEKGVLAWQPAPPL